MKGAVEAHQQEVGGDFEQRVAEKKQTGAEAVQGGREVQIRIHALGGEADIDTVHVGNTVADTEQR